MWDMAQQGLPVTVVKSAPAQEEINLLSTWRWAAGGHHTEKEDHHPGVAGSSQERQPLSFPREAPSM